MLVLLCALAIQLGCGSDSEPGQAFGTIEVPDMQLAYLDGSKAKLSDLEGKVVLLNFWATWCPPCREELPHFEDLHKAYRDEGLAIVGVSMDQAGADHVRSFSNDVGISYPIAMGAFEDMEKIWSQVEDIPTITGYGSEAPVAASGTVQMMPTTFVIDRTGRIYQKHVGPRDRAALEPTLRKLMGMTGAS